MRYMSILPCSTEDYYGFSVVVAVSGCSHQCEGCWSKASWRYTEGTEFTEETYQTLLALAKPDHISSIVWQGGDPLFHKNYKAVIEISRRLKKDLPNKKIVLFTGFTLWQIESDFLRAPILNTIDVLVDGKYEKDNPTTKPFRGSDNQRLIVLSQG